MATIAIGDIHGNCRALDDLLKQIEPELTDDDTVVFLGDYIDRGPDSRGCIDAILRLRDERLCPVVALKGNHEEWMLRTMEDPRRHSWLIAMQALTTIVSYSPSAADRISAAADAAGPALVLGSVALPYDAFFDAHRTRRRPRPWSGGHPRF